MKWLHHGFHKIMKNIKMHDCHIKLMLWIFVIVRQTRGLSQPAPYAPNRWWEKGGKLDGMGV